MDFLFIHYLYSKKGMGVFDGEGKNFQFFKEFKKIDEFYLAFNKEFEKEVLSIINSYSPGFERTRDFDELLRQYAAIALSLTHTVLDKDKSYPDFRKAEDLSALRGYYEKAAPSVENNELAEKIHMKTKELMVKYYSKIYDLSGDGFRLLELNLKLFNIEFMIGLDHLKLFPVSESPGLT
jgi:hypothetical protein